MMNILHGLKDQGHLEVGGFLEGFSDMEAMRPPFLAPTKPPSRAAQKVVVVADPVAPARAAPSAAAKPKFFMDRGAPTGKNALLSACSNLDCAACSFTQVEPPIRRSDCAFVFDPMRGARVDKADLLNVLMKTRLTLDVSLWDRTIGYCGGTA